MDRQMDDMRLQYRALHYSASGGKKAELINYFYYPTSLVLVSDPQVQTKNVIISTLHATPCGRHEPWVA